MAEGKYIAYYRVSTDRQGQSGLGLEAQRTAVTQWLNGGNWQMLEEFTEIESGKRKDRPRLGEALKACKKHRATLIIAKLDRLARNVHFISGLMEAGIEFVAVDNPHANKLMLHMLAAFAEHEREQISKRTKQALQAAKSRGQILGSHGHQLAIKNRAKAEQHRFAMKPVVQALIEEGFDTCRSIAAELNKRKIATFKKSGIWHPSTVMPIKRICDTSFLSAESRGA